MRGFVKEGRCVVDEERRRDGVRCVGWWGER